MSGWLDREEDWLGPRRMDFPVPSPPALRAALEGAPVVYWVPVKCPFCGHSKCPVKSSRGKFRHHKCQDCGKCFKSVEKK